MVGLLDIAPLTETVAIRGEDWMVHGVTAEALVPLLQNSPELRKLMTDRSDVDVASRLIGASPTLLAIVIAHALGFTPSDERYHRACASAMNLTVGEQYEIIRACLRVTFPRGVGPFVADLTSLAEEINAASEGGVIGKVQGTR